jgi:hypothetical protein
MPRSHQIRTDLATITGKFMHMSGAFPADMARGKIDNPGSQTRESDA